jgi:DNA-binding transcriptional LysR family regulator
MKKSCSIEALALLHCLESERNLSAAAAKLQLPVSTASRYLSELRDFFGDPLFTRCREGLIPTRKARELAIKADALLAEYSQIIEPDAFNPATAHREIFIGCVDNAPFSLFPDLAGMIRRAAPGLTLTYLPISGDRYELLRHHELDFIISPIQGQAQDGFHSLSLGKNRYRLVCGETHPLAQEAGPVPDSSVLQFPFVDIILKSRRREVLLLRNIRFPAWSTAHSAVKTYYFLPFVHSLNGSDLVMVLPERTAFRLQKAYGIRLVNTSTQSIGDETRIVWHDNTHRDPLMQWLRAMFMSAADQVASAD